MKKFFLKVFNIKVVSIILAVALWYYVAGVQGPTMVRTFKVPVVPINVEAGVVIKNKIDYVNIAAEGPSKTILGVKEQDFTALINLAGKTQGVYYIGVEVNPPLSGISIKSISPVRAKVSLEKLSTVTMPVSVEFKGEAESDFLPGTPIITPDKVYITGPESILNNIAKVFVEVDLTQINSEATLTLPVKLLGKDEQTVQNVQINPINCIVKVSEISASISKTVPIVPNLSGTVFKGFGIESVSAEPSVISISGDFKTISNIDYISTDALNISNITKSTMVQTSLVIPEGVNITESKECKVNIDIEPIITKELSLTIIAKTDEGKTAKVSPEKVNLVISGFSDVLNNINITSISALVDATGMSDGTYVLPVTINGIPKDTLISIVKPDSVNVTVSSSSSE